MANYAKTNIGNESRVELHETLSLTGAESASINFLLEQVFHLSIPTKIMKKYMALSQVQVESIAPVLDIKIPHRRY